MQKEQKLIINKIANPKDVINVNNLTFSYNKREDRILFIVNHDSVEQRIDFFVTRRMMIKLLDAFDVILINDCDNGKVFKKLYGEQKLLLPENIIEDKNTKDKNEINADDTVWEKCVDSQDIDFTKINKSIILDTLSYSINKDNISFKFIANDKTLAISHMTKLTFQRTLSSMMRVIPFLNWGISPHILD